MGTMGTMFAFIYIIIIFGAPFLMTGLNIIFLINNKKSLVFELVSFLIGAFYMRVAYSIMGPKHYTEALYKNTGTYHEAFSRDHVPTLIFFCLFGLLCYFILKFYKRQFSPLVESVHLAGTYIGTIVNIFMAVQLSKGVFGEFANRPVIIFMYLFFLNYFAMMICLLVRIAKRKALDQGEKEYSNVILNRCNKFLVKGANRFIAAVVLMLPLLGISILILTLFGQQPDSIIKVFTETSDWVLSTKISPPPIEYDGHYLCTVSLRGHKKLVKPLRYGLRHGKKIVVNRQLCVANAFEQLIMEKWPGFHRGVRNFYDTYGYPISKFIKKAWVADIVYIIMKPLEWIFLITLYLFDEKPENRIAKQYLPLTLKGL